MNFESLVGTDEEWEGCSGQREKQMQRQIGVKLHDKYVD